MARQSQLGLIPSVVLGCVAGLVLSGFAWSDAAVFQWGVGKPLWLVACGLFASLGLIIASALLLARFAHSMNPHPGAFVMPVIIAAIGSYAYASIDMTALSAKGGVIFAIALALTMRELRSGETGHLTEPG